MGGCMWVEGRNQSFLTGLNFPVPNLPPPPFLDQLHQEDGKTDDSSSSPLSVLAWIFLFQESRVISILDLAKLAYTFCSQINILAQRKKLESLKRNTNSPKDGVQYNERPKFWHFYAQAYFKNVLLIWFSEFSCWKFDPRALENKGAMLQNGQHARGW